MHFYSTLHKAKDLFNFDLLKSSTKYIIFNTMFN